MPAISDEQPADQLRIGSVLNKSSPVPLREARHLLAHVFGQSREWLIAHPEAALTPEQTQQFDDLLAQAATGAPLPYLLGEWEFFGLKFNVTPDVLIPRPETELLVERALAQSKIQNQKSKILDVGTGSGIIAVTLATKLPNAEITATDISSAALAVAHANAEKHNVADRLTFIESDLLSFRNPPASRAFHIIAANLPYIPSADLNSLAVAKHEPRLALDGGPDGLGLIRRLLADAPEALAPEGCILLEIEYRQAEAVVALAKAAFPDARLKAHKDLAGLDRVVEVDARRSDGLNPPRAML